MSIIGLIVLLVVCGFALWLINTYIPMQPPFKAIMNAIVILVLVLFILQSFGLFGGLGGSNLVLHR